MEIRGPFFIWLCRKAPIDFEVKHPIIIPQHTHFTELLIRQYHTELGHSCAVHTWAEATQWGGGLGEESPYSSQRSFL